MFTAGSRANERNRAISRVMSRSRRRPSSHEPTARATTPPKNQTIARGIHGGMASAGPSHPARSSAAARAEPSGRGPAGERSATGVGAVVGSWGSPGGSSAIARPCHARGAGRGWSCRSSVPVRLGPGTRTSMRPSTSRTAKVATSPLGSRRPVHRQLRAVALGVEAPEVAEADQLLAVDHPGAGQVRPLVRAPGVAGGEHARRRAPHHDLVVADLDRGRRARQPRRRSPARRSRPRTHATRCRNAVSSRARAVPLPSTTVDAFADLFAANAEYVSGFALGDLAAPPSRHVAVVTCMDARIDPLAILGLGPRRRPRAAQRRRPRHRRRAALAREVGQPARGHPGRRHAPHRLRRRQDQAADLRAKVTEATGNDPADVDFHLIDDQDEALRADVEAVQDCPYLPAGIEVVGLLYDVTTGVAAPKLSAVVG